MDTTKKTPKKTAQKVNYEKPVQLSIWDILEHPLFEKKLTEEIDLLKFAGENYTSLKSRIEEQYKRDLAILEEGKDNQMKELLKDYPKPEDLTVKYVEVITKKSRLGSHKRQLIETVFSRIVKSCAIDIINEKAKEKQACVESSSRKDLN